MKNAEYFNAFNDSCPVHKTNLTKEYTFGNGLYGATVYTFKGCGCAVCYENNGFRNHPQYFTTYNQAAAKARMIKAMQRSF